MKHEVTNLDPSNEERSSIIVFILHSKEMQCIQPIDHSLDGILVYDNERETPMAYAGISCCRDSITILRAQFCQLLFYTVPAKLRET
jgi:hypothetical protein